MPLRYRRFRRQRRAEGKWYSDVTFDPGDLNPLEIDAILLGLLLAGKALVDDRGLEEIQDRFRSSTVDTVRSLFRTQILVDEATDFSPIQLACMAQLADPSTNSLLVCGDFNQRITAWGSRSTDDLRWVAPNLRTEEILVSYRHSRQLNDLARKS